MKETKYPPLGSTQDDYYLEGHDSFIVVSYRSGQIETINKKSGQVSLVSVESFVKIEKVEEDNEI